jgi:hypothetical protein
MAENSAHDIFRGILIGKGDLDSLPSIRKKFPENRQLFWESSISADTTGIDGDRGQ